MRHYKFIIIQQYQCFWDFSATFLRKDQSVTKIAFYLSTLLHIEIWLGHSNIQTTMIYTHLDETNKEVSAQVLIAKFQYILNNYKEKEIYEMGEDSLNNLYEDVKSEEEIKKVVISA